MSQLKLFFLGPPRIERDGSPVKVDTRKAIALLAYITVTNQPHSRDTLAALLWPEYDHSRARAVLRRTLSTLNTALAGTGLEIERDTITLTQTDQIWVDVIEFRRQVARCQTHGHHPEATCPACLPLLSQAAALYQADFLSGFSLRDSSEFDDWQFFQTEGLRQELADVLEKLVKVYSQQGEYEPAITAARRWAGLDPINEAARCHLMQLYTWTGQRNAALRQYHDVVRVLDEELGVSPQEETVALYRAIETNQLMPLVSEERPSPEASRRNRGVARPGIAAPEQGRHNFSPSPSPPSPALMRNLPAQTTAFIGRETELAGLNDLLIDPACRLVTLTGLGGVGKTRLAIEVATHQQERFADGIWFVSLSPVREVALISPAIADALAFNLYGTGDSKQQLLNYLRDKNLLLILDNLEHLLDGASLLVDILHEAPQVKLLATSRERLNLQGEWLFEVGGLTLPPPDQALKLETYSATALFLQSARRAHSGFELKPADQPAVARICELVDGLPLGIELAAAWVRMLSCAEIAQEIERNLDFLTAVNRGAPERHQSLRTAFDHSWNLLAAEERRILGRLSIFRGGFSREGAQYVAGTTLPVLSALVDKFLVRRVGEGSYSIHELVRQFVRGYLQEHPDELAAARQRHSDYYAEWVERLESRLKSSEQRASMLLLSQEYSNIPLASEWALTHGLVQNVRRLLRALFVFFELRSWYQEAVNLFQQMITRLQTYAAQNQIDLSAGASGPSRDYAICLGQLLALQGLFTFRVGRANPASDPGASSQAQILLRQSLSLLEPLNDPVALVDAYIYLGIVTHWSGDYPEAKSLLQRGLELCRVTGDHWAAGACLTHLGLVAYNQGDYEQAEQLLKESVETGRQVGDPRGQTLSLSVASMVATQLGAYDRAQMLLQESMALSSLNQDRWSMATGLNHLGQIALKREPPALAEAAYLFSESAALFKELGARWSLVWVLNHWGYAATAQANYIDARQKFLEALELGLTVPVLPGALMALGGMALVWARQGNACRALVLARHVLIHPASSNHTRVETQSLSTELTAQLSPEQLKAVETQFAEESFDDLVAEILLSR